MSISDLLALRVAYLLYSSKNSKSLRCAKNWPDSKTVSSDSIRVYLAFSVLFSLRGLIRHLIPLVLKRNSRWCFKYFCAATTSSQNRSEERRVGKECRS